MATKNLNFNINAKNKGARAFSTFQAGLSGVQRQTRQLQESNKSLMRGMTANRRIVQQVGMQFSDLGVQIAGGQSAILSLTQNVPQVVQMFGAWGGVLAAVITFVGLLTLTIVKSGQSIRDIADKFGVAANDANRLVDALIWMREAAYDSINFVVNNLDLLMTSLVGLVFVLQTRNVIAWVASGKAAAFATRQVKFFNLAITMTQRHGLKGAAAVLRLSGAFRLLGRAIVATGIGALAVAVGWLIERFVTLTGAVGNLGETFGLLGDVIVQFFQAIPKLLQGLIHRWVAMSARVWAITTGLLADIFDGFSGTINKVISLFHGLAKTVGIIFGAIGQELVNVMGAAVNQITKELDAVITGAANMYNLLNPFDNIEWEGLDKFLIPVNKIGSDMEQVAGKVSDAWEEVGEKDYVGRDSAFGKGLRDMSETAARASQGADMLGDMMFKAAWEAQPALREMIRLLKEADAASGNFDIRNLDFGKSEDGEASTKKMRERFEDIGKFVKKSANDLSKSMARAMGENNPFESIAENMKKALKDVAEDAHRDMQRFSQTMKDSFKDVIKGSKSMGDFLSGVVDQILDRLLDAALDPVFDMLAESIMGAFGVGGRKGGVFGVSNAASLFAGFFAKGGTIGAGKFGVVGENGPEIAYGGSRPQSILSNDMARRVMSGGGGSTGGVYITNNNHFNGVTREEIMADVVEAQRATLQQVRREFPKSAARYNRDYERGAVA